MQLTITSGLLIAVTTAIGILILVRGLRGADRYRSPWRRRAGIGVIGAGFIAWPPIYLYLSQYYLDMAWILVWFATIWTFAWGAKQAFQGAHRHHWPF